VPAAAGVLWLVQQVHGYPAEYLFRPSWDILVVQIGTWGALLAGSLLVAAAFGLVVAVFGRDPVLHAPRSPAVTAAWVAAIVLLGIALRVAFLDLIPAGFWVDGVHALKAASDDGRFFGAHEGRRLTPPGLGDSRVVVFGLYLDFLRALLVVAGDRRVAYHLMNLLPACLVPLGVWAVARRLTTGTGALLAAFAAAVSLWPLVLARWGWDQQLMTVLLLFALERLAAGMGEGKPGRLFTGGLLAGLACHTFIGGFVGAAGLVVWCGREAIGSRSPRRVLAPLAGVALALLPIGIFYAEHPELLGGRVLEARLRGSAPSVAAVLAVNALDYAGELFFTPDPSTRHGLVREAQLTPWVVGLLVLGTVSAMRGDRRDAAGWRGLAALLAATLAGGVLSSRSAAPSAYRTGLAGALAFVPIGVGLARVTGSALWSAGARRALVLLLPLLLFATDFSRFLRWGLPERGGPVFPLQANAAGRFLAIAGVKRTLVDPAIFREDASSSWVAAFHVAPERARDPLPALRIETLDRASTAGVDWYVTNSRPTGRRLVRLGEPDGPAVVAVRLR
jgi:hypothetical protein